MDIKEAIDICDSWFAHLERQKERAKKLAELAAMARKGTDEAKEAQKQLRQIDRQPRVYDGGRLEPAVRYLCELHRHQQRVDI